MAKNLSIVAQGISGDEGHLLGYNVSDNGIYTPAIGDVVRGTSATYVAQDGTIKTASPNVARVDYTNGVAELLLEPESTNLIKKSENFGLWSIQSGTTTQSGFTSPKGDNSAYLVKSDGANGILFGVASIGGLNTKSIYLKGSFDGQIVQLKDSQSTINRLYLTLSTKWERYSLTETQPSSSGIGLWVDDIDSNGVYMWGGQIEQKGFATSYIPTNGSQVTRSADSLINFGSSQLIDSNSGVLFFEGIPSDGVLGLLDPNDLFNNVMFQKDVSGISGLVNNTRSLYFNGFSEGDVLKIVIKYNGSQYSLFINGVLIDTPSISSMVNMNTLNFNYSNGAVAFYGRVRQVKHLPYNTNISTL